MFNALSSINPAAVTAARRGREVERFYADLVGTLAFKFSLNAGAKNLVLSVPSRVIMSPFAVGRCSEPETCCEA